MSRSLRTSARKSEVVRIGDREEAERNLLPCHHQAKAHKGSDFACGEIKCLRFRRHRCFIGPAAAPRFFRLTTSHFRGYLGRQRRGPQSIKLIRSLPRYPLCPSYGFTKGNSCLSQPRSPYSQICLLRSTAIHQTRIHSLFDLSLSIQSSAPAHLPPANLRCASLLVCSSSRVQHPLRDALSFDRTPNTAHPQLPRAE